MDFICPVSEKFGIKSSLSPINRQNILVHILIVSQIFKRLHSVHDNKSVLRGSGEFV